MKKSNNSNNKKSADGSVVQRAPQANPRAARQPHDTGMPPLFNRTGVEASPLDAKELIEGAKLQPPTPGDPTEIIEVRREYDVEAGPVGTMPPPTSAKGAIETAKEAVQGKKANVLIDKIGERLAFERTGVRLYEGLLMKLDVRGGFDGGPTRDELEEFLDEELSHFHMLVDAMKKLGADPTAMTPSADVAAVLSMGVPAVISDPRTTLAQCLEAILVAELVDNDCWSSLVQLCEEMGEDNLADQMRQALLEEGQHLEAVRTWVQAATSAAARREETEVPVEERARI